MNKLLVIFLCLFAGFLLIACGEDTLFLNSEATTKVDCRYVFTDQTDDMIGAWEPKRIISLQDMDTVYYEPGEGHTGFMFTHYYSDSFELRDDNRIATYYVRWGRPCISNPGSPWEVSNGNLIVYILDDTLTLPILRINSTELEIQDVVNFKDSHVTFRKVNI